MVMIALGYNKEGKLVETKPVFRESSRREKLFSLYMVHIYGTHYITMLWLHWMNRRPKWFYVLRAVPLRRFEWYFREIQRILCIPTIMRWVLGIDDAGYEIK